jgi:predicted N-acetyltransferase YhbS
MPSSAVEVRAARAEDCQQIVRLQADRNGPGAEPDSLLRDPLVGPERFTVAVDHGHVVSSLCLLDTGFVLEGVALPGGQPEYVATAEEYGHRGLVRQQMELVHQWSADLGHVLQVIAGIPYFYRRFGYEYAVPFPQVRLVTPGVALDTPPGWKVREASPDDLPELRRLQSAANRDAALAAVADDAWWNRSLANEGMPWFVAEADGLRAAARIGAGPPGVGQAVTVLHAPAADHHEGLWALLAHVAAQGRPVGFEVRRSTTAALGGVSHPHPRRYALYARVADPILMLDRLRPVLGARLARSSRAGTSGELLLSSYASSVLLTWEGGEFVAIEASGPVQGPVAAGGAGVPPDLMATLLLGRYGAAGLAARHDDVDCGRVVDLMEILFPAITADLSLL